MRLGITLDGRGPVADVLPVVAAAEEQGFECVWIAEHLGHRDSMVYAATVLDRTRDLMVGCGAISPYYRHPAHIAMGAATLRETYGPRIRVMLGLGNADDIALLGAQPRSSARAVREATVTVRALLAEGRAEVRGETFVTAGVRLLVERTGVPLYIAAVRRGMLRLAGELGDGVSLSAATSPAHVHDAVAHVRAGAAAAGRDPERLDVTCNIITAIGPTRREALRTVKRQLAWILLGGNDYLFEFQPARLDKEAVRRALESGDADRLDRAIPDVTADALAIASTGDDLKERLARFEAAGVRLGLLRLTGTASEQVAIIRSLAPEKREQREGH